MIDQWIAKANRMAAEHGWKLQVVQQESTGAYMIFPAKDKLGIGYRCLWVTGEVMGDVT